MAKPPQVTGLTTQALSIHEIKLDWTSQQGIDHYKIYRKMGNDFKNIGESTKPTFIDGGLSSGSSYDYHVSAVSIWSEVGSPSAVKNDRTLPGPADEQVRRNQRVQQVAGNLRDRLRDDPRTVPVDFPPCSDLYLSLIYKLKLQQPIDKRDLLTELFDQYFSFGRHFGYEPEAFRNPSPDTTCSIFCLPPSCVGLNGNRSRNVRLRRLYIADAVWLFYFEQFGIFEIMNVILSDFATRGKYPIANNNTTTRILEAMTRNTMSGNSSRLRDRISSYARSLGWTTPKGRKLGLNGILSNDGFNVTFHRFIQTALAYYKERRLATAVRGQPAPTGPSAAPVSVRIAVNDLIDLLRRAFKPFDYGRNYYNILNGIVWAIGAISIVRDLRTTLGIPEKFDDPYQYLSAAYDILITGKAITPSQTNRFKLHFECARDARDILLDLEEGVLSIDPIQGASELEDWLDLVEERIEGYRTAYLELTGFDLAAPEVRIGERGHPRISQQVLASRPQARMT